LGKALAVGEKLSFEEDEGRVDIRGVTLQRDLVPVRSGGRHVKEGTHSQKKRKKAPIRVSAGRGRKLQEGQWQFAILKRKIPL